MPNVSRATFVAGQRDPAATIWLSRERRGRPSDEHATDREPLLNARARRILGYFALLAFPPHGPKP